MRERAVELKVFQLKECIKTTHSEISHWETDTVKLKHHQFLLSAYFVPGTLPGVSRSSPGRIHQPGESGKHNYAPRAAARICAGTMGCRGCVRDRMTSRSLGDGKAQASL